MVLEVELDLPLLTDDVPEEGLVQGLPRDGLPRLLHGRDARPFPDLVQVGLGLGEVSGLDAGLGVAEIEFGNPHKRPRIVNRGFEKGRDCIAWINALFVEIARR